MAELLLFILLAMYVLQPKDKRNSEANKRLVTTVIIGMVLLGILNDMAPFFSLLIQLAAIGGIGYWFYKKFREKQDSNRRRSEYGWDPQRWDRERTQTEEKYTQAQKKASFMSSAEDSRLPKSAKKRRRIVEDFNEKYDLYLTAEQIQSIVNSSYMSQIWRSELIAMDQKYETVYEWFQGPMSWLRVYMYAFHVQEITSDIRQQENIGMYAFQAVFSYSDTLGGLSLTERIKAVNNKFFTSFDDISFMIAYRFLEDKGLAHELNGADIPVNGDSADDLVRKYQV